MDSRFVYLGAFALAGVATLGMFSVGITRTTTVAPQPIVTMTPAGGPVAPSASKEIHLEVSGMTSEGGSVDAVRSALEAVEGVIEAEVSLPDKAVIRLKKEVSGKDLEDAVKQAGEQYDARVIATRG
jgi:copper chaperone CopZ